MYSKNEWVEMTQLNGKTHYLVAMSPELGFTPLDEEVIFLGSREVSPVERLILENYDKIQAAMAKKHLKLFYLPANLKSFGSDRMQYVSPNSPRPWKLDFGQAELWEGFYSRLYDAALTPLEEEPQLLRYKKVLSTVDELANAAQQGRKPCLIFSHRSIPNVGSAKGLMAYFDDYIDGVGSERVFFSLAKPQSAEEHADFYFDQQVKKLADEVRERVEALRQLGVTELMLKSLLVIPKPSKSRLTITKDYRIILTDYDNREVKMAVLPKVLYFFYLRHPEGVTFKHLSDHQEELMGLYKALSNRINFIKMNSSIRDLVDPTKNSINEKASLVRSAFLNEFDEEIMKDYCISSDKDRRKIITLDRSLVVDESGIVMHP